MQQQPDDHSRNHPQQDMDQRQMAASDPFMLHLAEVNAD